MQSTFHENLIECYEIVKFSINDNVNEKRLVFSFSKIKIMKKLSLYVFLVLFFFGNVFAKSTKRDNKLNQLFDQLKKSNDVSIAFKIEMKIWNIWSIHPTQEKLTTALAIGSKLMSGGELDSAYKIFSTIVESEPDWAEGWNKRATVLYLMGKYLDSLNNIDEVLKREDRHFGALSGQALVQIKLKNYEKAIKSYRAVQKIYPSIRSAEIMITQLQELIKEEAI